MEHFENNFENTIENHAETHLENGGQNPQPMELPAEPVQPQSAPDWESVPVQPQSDAPRPEANQNRPRQTIVLGSDAGNGGNGTGGKPKKKMAAWKKGLIVLAIIIVCVVLLTAGCNKLADGITIKVNGGTSNEVTTNYTEPYIGTLYVQGTIDEYGTGTYNHQYLLNAIDAMMEDSCNEGIILYVDTPGGSVYASDELYLKIKEYQEKTERPVYSSMQSQAASGGYYISAPCDKIIANRNCWTGSIGVTMGTFIDISQLMEDLGIKTTTITSGDNKAMGSNFDEMTAEQRQIFQSLVDEAYDQFVGIVAEGRGMDEAVVRTLADGRIYTAKQAAENGLVDAIGTYEEAIADMQETYGLGDCAVEDFIPPASNDLYSLLGILAEDRGSDALTEAQLIEELVTLNNTFRVSYISGIVK